jgi:hypothetical protein
MPLLVLPDLRHAVDNLREVEIVLASGNIVRANDHENTDLFWAVRGVCSYN